MVLEQNLNWHSAKRSDKTDTSPSVNLARLLVGSVETGSSVLVSRPFLRIFRIHPAPKSGSDCPNFFVPSPSPVQVMARSFVNLKCQWWQFGRITRVLGVESPVSKKKHSVYRQTSQQFFQQVHWTTITKVWSSVGIERRCVKESVDKGELNFCEFFFYST